VSRSRSEAGISARLATASARIPAWLGETSRVVRAFVDSWGRATLCNVESLLPRAFQRGRRCRQADEGAVLAMKLSLFRSFRRGSGKQSTASQEPTPPHPPEPALRSNSDEGHLLPHSEKRVGEKDARQTLWVAIPGLCSRLSDSAQPPALGGSVSTHVSGTPGWGFFASLRMTGPSEIEELASLLPRLRVQKKTP
jgi:hypothetical protein